MARRDARARCPPRSAATSTASTARTGTTSGASGRRTPSSSGRRRATRVQGRDDVLPYYRRCSSRTPVHHDDPYAIHVCRRHGHGRDRVQRRDARGRPGRVRGGRRLHARGREDPPADDLVRHRPRPQAATPGAPDRRLRTLVAHAAAESPFYRRRFEELGLAADDVAADLTLLPPTTRLDLAGAPRRPPGDGRRKRPPGPRLRRVRAAVDGGGRRRDRRRARCRARARRRPRRRPRPPARVAPRPGGGRRPARRACRRPGHGRPGCRRGRDGRHRLFAPAHSDVAAFRERAAGLGSGLPAVRLVVGTAADAAGWPHAPLLGSPPTGVVAAACGQGDGLHVLPSQIVEITSRRARPSSRASRASSWSPRSDGAALRSCASPSGSGVPSSRAPAPAAAACRDSGVRREAARRRRQIGSGRGAQPRRLDRARLVPRVLPPRRLGRPLRRLPGAARRGRRRADHPAARARPPLEPRARALPVRARRPAARSSPRWPTPSTGTGRGSSSS